MRALLRTTVPALTMLIATSSAWAQSVAFVAVGEDPSAPVRRAAIRFSEALEEQEDFEVVASTEMRRALAGEPAPDDGDDALADVRRLVARAEGDRLRQSLVRLGERLGLDLIVSMRRVGGEIEFRGFDVARNAFYRGTTMVDAAAPPGEEALLAFVGPRVRATGVERGDGAAGDPREERPRRRRRSRWWIWAVVGGAVAAAVLVGVLVQPDPVEDTGVTIRIVNP